MKLRKPNSERGFSLVMVMVLVGTAILFLSGALQWSSAGSGLTERNNDYYTAMAAAEAATEKVIAQMSKDFQEGGHSKVESNWNAGYYQTLVPTTSESPDWANYDFTDSSGVSGRMTVEQGEKGFGPLNWKYDGFNGTATTYRIISRARLTGSGTGALGTVKQEIQVAEIPLFEFGAFYNLPMEVDYSQHDLTFNGPIHSNTNVYFGPSVDLTFLDHVTSAGRIMLERLSTGVPLSRLSGSVSYQKASDAGVLSLNLPLGTNNTPELLHKIIEIPPPSESPDSLLGQQRFYNKADLIILVTNGIPMGMSGVYNNRANAVDVSGFVTTTNVMWDAREQKYFHLTEIDVDSLQIKYSDIINAIGREPKIIYIADTRYTNSLTDIDASGVRIVHGQTLPTGVGLTLATMNPLYVKGHFNANTTEPAALVCDALTVLSGDWDDSRGLTDILNSILNRLPLVSRLLGNASSFGAEINAGIITGIVPTGGGKYSGSMENAITLLEDWTTAPRFKFNGSLAVLYRSQMANQSFDNAVLRFSVLPLLKELLYDTNFKPQQASDLVTKLPHGTPLLRTLIRSDWSIAQAN